MKILGGGPCVTAEELQSILISKPDTQERIVKVELNYYRTTQKTDMISRPDLYRLNKISHEERLENLLILLSDDDLATGSIADLPTNDDALAIVQGTIIPTVVNAQVNTEFETNDNCVVLWYINGRWDWFIGYVKERLNDDQYMVDHLERVRSGNNSGWRYPSADDTNTVDHDQIIPIKIIGDWNITQNTRQMVFSIKNYAEIQRKFDDIVKKL